MPADTEESAIAHAVALLEAGRLVAFPTETVYGLGADADSELAVRRIFEVKGRPSSHPLIVHVGPNARLSDYARDVPSVAERLMAAFWPGPLTLIFRRAARVSLAVTGGQDTVGLRVPRHPLALSLLAAFGRGVAAPSANRFGRVSPTCAAHVRADLGDALDCVLDGGPSEVGVESTIVDVSRDAPVLLRPGGVPVEALEAEMRAPLRREGHGPVRVPGQLESHYAPRAELTVVTADALPSVALGLAARGARLGLMAPAGLPRIDVAEQIELPGDAAGYARGLYAALRDLDARGVDIILSVPPQETGLGLAVVDRLTRAATRRG
jgi:L-threonylcarbamoyladenylate synthase